MKSKALTGMVLAATIAIAVTGCASKGKWSAAKLCAGAGGKYSAQTQTCDQPAVSGKKASAMCDAHGGTYMADLQMCEVEGTK